MAAVNWSRHSTEFRGQCVNELKLETPPSGVTIKACKACMVPVRIPTPCVECDGHPLPRNWRLVAEKIGGTSTTFEGYYAGSFLLGFYNFHCVSNKTALYPDLPNSYGDIIPNSNVASVRAPVRFDYGGDFRSSCIYRWPAEAMPRGHWGSGLPKPYFGEFGREDGIYQLIYFCNRTEKRPGSVWVALIAVGFVQTRDPTPLDYYLEPFIRYWYYRTTDHPFKDAAGRLTGVAQGWLDCEHGGTLYHYAKVGSATVPTWKFVFSR